MMMMLYNILYTEIFHTTSVTEAQLNSGTGDGLSDSFQFTF